LCLFAMSAVASAGVITFDDLNTRDSFYILGISNTYQGFVWTSSGPELVGWAVATVSDPAVSPAPTPVSGESYAWNWAGVQSLYITFPTPYSVSGAYFATLSPGYAYNASSITMYGYDAADNLIASSAPLSLSDTFQYLSANFTGITKLEIRANSSEAWFSVDNIGVSASGVPEPSTFGIVALVVAFFGWHARRRVGAAYDRPEAEIERITDQRKLEALASFSQFRVCTGYRCRASKP